MSGYIYLSYYLSPTSPCYGNNPPFQMKAERSLGSGDSCNTHLLMLHNHTGTHVDFPSHFDGLGKTSSDYSASELIFERPVVLSCPKEAGGMIVPEDIWPHAQGLVGKDLILIKTGFYKMRNEDVYRHDNPGVHPDTVTYIRESFPFVRCLGVDSISITSATTQNRQLGRAAHQKAFQRNGFSGEPLLLLEDVDFSHPQSSSLKRVFVAPLMVKDIDGVPCTIIGEL